jgi:hypothetical protein
MGEFFPEKCFEIVTLPCHHLDEILTRHGLKGLPRERFIRRAHRTFGLFRTFGTFGTF